MKFGAVARERVRDFHDYSIATSLPGLPNFFEYVKRISEEAFAVQLPHCRSSQLCPTFGSHNSVTIESFPAVSCLNFRQSLPSSEGKRHPWQPGAGKSWVPSARAAGLVWEIDADDIPDVAQVLGEDWPDVGRLGWD